MHHDKHPHLEKAHPHHMESHHANPQNKYQPTQFHADYNYFEAEDGNIVWAAALGLAWKELCHLFKVEHLTPHGHHDKLQKIAENFNHNAFSLKDLNPNSYYIKSGYGPSTVDTINKERGDKFKECTFPPIQAQLGPHDIIAYAYLYKKVMYPFKFAKKPGKSFTFHGKFYTKEVESFYAEDNDQFQQVEVYDYKDKNNFTVGLKDAAKQDQIFLCKDGKHMTVKDVIHHITVLSEKPQQELQFIMESDDFQVPVLNLDYNRNVQQLVGVSFKEIPGYSVEQVVEGVKLKLDESGAVVENEGMMIMDECAIMSNRCLKFDSPFWVVMKEIGKHPYICIKINNI